MNPFFLSDDGYTDRVYLSGVVKYKDADGKEQSRRIHPDVRVFFRPTTNVQRSEINDRIGQLPAREKEKGVDDLMAHEVGNRLVSWQFFDDEGRPVSSFKNPDGTESKVPEPDADSLKSLRNERLWGRLCAVVHFGSDNGDQDPEYATKEGTPAKRVSKKQGN